MTPTIDNYRQYLRDMLRIYGYYDCGKFESAEADDLRDAMEEPWYTLTEAEQKRIRGLALDLNYIREAKRSADGSIEQGRDQLIAASRLRAVGELDQALELLRASQNDIYPPNLSFLRGRIWMELDVPEVAEEFLRDARHFDGANQNLQG